MDTTWLEVTVETTEPQLDDLCARLTMNGATGLAIEDENDFKTLRKIFSCEKFIIYYRLIFYGENLINPR